jgi:hypothetical protein
VKGAMMNSKKIENVRKENLAKFKKRTVDVTEHFEKGRKGDKPRRRKRK